MRERRRKTRNSAANLLREAEKGLKEVAAVLDLRRLALITSETLERRYLLSGLPLDPGIDLTQAAGGLQQSLNSAESELGPLLDHPLPLVGNQLSSAVTTLNDLATQLQNGLSGTNTESAVEQALVSTLGSRITDLVGGNFNPADVIETPDAGQTEITRVEFDLNLHQSAQVVNTQLAFNPGLPGLGLAVNAHVQVTVGYDFKLYFGYDKNFGFFINTNPASELALHVDMHIAGSNFTGSLGPLQLTAQDHVNTGQNDPYQPSDFNATFAVDLGDSNAGQNGLLPLSNLGSNLTVGATVSGDAVVNLDTNLSFGSDANFPSLSALFHLEWGFNSANLSNGGSISSFGSEPDIGFENVGLDVGGFFNKFVTPIISDVQQVLQPIQPFINFLNTRVPILSDVPFLVSLYDSNHDGSVSLLEAASALEPGNSMLQFLTTVDNIDTFVQKIQPPTLGAGLTLNLGSFDLGGTNNANGADLRSLANLDSVDLTDTDAATDIVQQMQQLGQKVGSLLGSDAGEKVADFLSSLTSDFDQDGSDDAGTDPKMDFPIVDDPQSAFGMLLGQDVDLFTLTLPKKLFNDSLDEFFSILGPLGVELKGNVNGSTDWIQINTNLTMGYDTHGMTEFFNDGFNPNKLAGDLADGFYISTNVDPNNPTVQPPPVLDIELGMEANAELNAVVASAGVGGGITGSATFRLNDPHTSTQFPYGQGKIRFADIENELTDDTLFAAHGSVSAFLHAFVQVGVDTPAGFVGYKQDYDIASVTIIDLDFTPPTPVLAQPIGNPSDGIYQLNIGPNASQRLPGATDGDDAITVTPLGPAVNGAQNLQIDGFGYSHEYDNVKQIYGEGGNGNNSITIVSGVQIPVMIYGGFAPTDRPANPSIGNDTIHAGDGPTTIIGDTGDDDLYAGSGADDLEGGGGNNTFHVQAGTGAVTIYGNASSMPPNPGATNALVVLGTPNNGDTMTIGKSDGAFTVSAPGTSLSASGVNELNVEANADILVLNDVSGTSLQSIGINLGDLDQPTGSTTPHQVIVNIAPGQGASVLEDTTSVTTVTGLPISTGVALDVTNLGLEMAVADVQGDSLTINASGTSPATTAQTTTVLGNLALVHTSGSGATFHIISDSGPTSILESPGTTGDAVTIDSTNAATIVTTRGTNSVTIGTLLSKIIGPITITGDPSGTTALTLSDVPDNATRSGTITPSQITGLGMVGNIAYTNLSSIAILLGGGANTFIATGPSAEALSIFGGANNDTINATAWNTAVTILGGLGNDTITAGDGNDSIEGGTGQHVFSPGDPPTGNDSIVVSNGNDTIFGGKGNDTISAGNGNSQITGGVGNDSISAGGGNNTITGGTGSDGITVGNGNNIITGGTVADTISAGNGDNQIVGGAANNITAGAGSNVITGGIGNDTIHAGDGNNSIIGNAGNDSITVGNGQNSITGGGNDTITTGTGSDFILAGNGSGTSTIHGGGGYDLLVLSEDANQTLTNSSLIGLGTINFSGISAISMIGGPSGNLFTVSAWTGGPVQIVGGGGNDTVASSNNTDFTLIDTSLKRSDGTAFSLSGIGSANLTGGANNNKFDVSLWTGSGTISGGGGNNQIISVANVNATLTNSSLARSGRGTLTLSNISSAELVAGSGNNVLDTHAFSHAVVLDGGAGNDTLLGTAFSDSIWGGTGQDSIVGGGGNALIDALNGSGDVIIGGAGHDTIYGSPAADTITIGATGNIVFGEGGNDTVNGTGAGDTVVSGGGPSGFVAPTPIVDPLANPTFPAMLPTGPNSGGQWQEFGGSASAGGVSSSPGAAVDPVVAVSSSGTYMAWADNRSGHYQIYVAENTGSGWQELAGSAHGVGISNSNGDSRRPTITLDGSGNPIVAWTQFNGSLSEIHAASFNGTSWTSLGTVSSSGHADNAKIVQTAAGPVVAWLDSGGAVTNVFVESYNGSSWSALGSGAASGTGISGSASSVSGLSLATDGTKVAATWTQVIGLTTQIYLKQFSGGIWSGVDGSASGNGLSNTAGNAAQPTVAYFGGSLYAAWQATVNGVSSIAAAVAGVSTWNALNISIPANISPSFAAGAASQPQLAAGGGTLNLAWTQDRLPGAAGQAMAIFAARLNGSTFNAQLPSDVTFNGIQGRSTALSTIALAADPSGHPFIAWADTSSGSQQVYLRGDLLNLHNVYYVNQGGSLATAFNTQIGSAANNGTSAATPKDSVQGILNQYTLVTGDVILVDRGSYSGFSANSSSGNYLVIGSDGVPTVVTSSTSLTSTQNVGLQQLQLGSVSETNTNGTSLVNDNSGAVSISGGSNSQIAHCAIGSLGISGSASNITAENGTIGSLSISGGGGLLIRNNQIGATTISGAAGGTITQNTIYNLGGTALSITAAFTGSIDHNDIRNSTIGVNYAASAPLNANRIDGNTTGVVSTVSNPSAAFGFVGTLVPNQIFNNTTGVNLTGTMQNQHVYANTTGVTGSGTLGGSSLDLANLIELNSTGVDFNGPIQFNRIAANNIGINAHSSQLIDHNLIYNNTTAGIQTNGATDVRIISNTFYNTAGKAVWVNGGSSNVQVMNNIFDADGAGAYDVYVNDDSQSGFFSDFNDLFADSGGLLVHWFIDFVDILDWQVDLALYDQHSIGAAAINPTEGQPQFADPYIGDFRVFDLFTPQRSSSPTIGAGAPYMDQALPATYQNLLSNPSFENGVTGWSVNVGGTTQSGNPTAFDGSSYFFAGSVASGFAEQTVSLTSAGYTPAQLDAQNLELVFGGRVRSGNEATPDQGTLVLTFLDGSSNSLGTDTLTATNVSGRWELLGDRVNIPIGTRSVRYHFQNLRQTGATDDSYLDNAFLYVVSNNVAPDLGAYGNSSAQNDRTLPHVQVKSPDLYVDWVAGQAHQIRWATYGKSDGSAVKIDLYQNGSFLQMIVASTPDTGSFAWTPPTNMAGTHGLTVRISLVTTPSAYDESTETFTIPELGNNYYINDNSTTGDQYTSAVGSNRNDGKLASAPKPLLTNLMRIYSLSAADTIFIDNGTYGDFQAATFSSNASIGTGAGSTVLGPTNNGTSAAIQGLGVTNDGIIDINNANFVTIKNLTLAGAQYGVWIKNASQNVLLSHITANNASQDGIRIESDSTGAALDHITVNNNGHDGLNILGNTTTLDSITANSNGNDGVFVGGNFTSLTNSSADNNVVNGFNLSNPGSAVITHNEASGNQVGIKVNNNTSSTTTVVGSANLNARLGNIVHNNSQVGILAVSAINVVGNTVYGQSAAGAIGISVTGVSSVSDNVVWGNETGISATNGTVAINNNRVFDNSAVGINLSGSSTTQGDVVYSNGIGIKDTSPNTVTPIALNDLIYGNSSVGILLIGGTSAFILQTTIYQLAGDAVQLANDINNNGASNVTLRNDILFTSGAFDLDVSPKSEQGFKSDYNLFFTGGGGQVGQWENIARSTLSSWRAGSSTDVNSLYADPKFVNVNGADGQLGFTGGTDHGSDDDFHEQSTAGSFHNGSLAPVISGITGLPVLQTATLTADASESPAIDRGDPTSSFANEPSPNGGFVNIGAYGNTAQASESPNPYVLILIPNGGEAALAGQNYLVKWRSEDMGSTVNIDLLEGASPQTASVVENIVTGAANSGQFNWSIPSNTSAAGDYFIRVSRTDAPSAPGISSTAFAIKAATTSFYVNDGSVNASGDWTTAPGNDANDGLTPATPKASIQALLQAYNLGAGDTIFVDAGTYNLGGNIVIPAADSGLTIEGYNNATFPSRAAVLNRGVTASGNDAFDIQGATSITLDHLSITGADVGINASSGAGSTGLTITNNLIFNNADFGVELGSGNGGAMISGNQVSGTTSANSGEGAIYSNGNLVTISNNQVFNNVGNGILVQNGSSSAISGNNVHNNVIGINASTAIVSGNIVNANSQVGIIAAGTSSVTGNTTSNNVGSNSSFSQAGIYVSGNGATVSGNVSFGNQNGIFYAGGGTASGNLLYNNSVAGIGATINSQFTASTNVIYGNGWGIKLPFGAFPTLQNNVIYNNTSGGIDLAVGESTSVINNTIYQPTGDGIRIDSGSSSSTITLRNNIVWTLAGFDMNVDPSADGHVVSDYNDLYVTGTGQVGLWQGATRANLASWQSASQLDANSISVDPLFVNIAGGDFHEQSQFGSFHGGSLAVILNNITSLPQSVPPPSATNDANTSPAIDRGSPSDSFANEPTPSGRFINLGAYGNTTQASISAAQYVLVIHPNGGDTWATKQIFNIQWRDDEFGSASVNIDLLQGASAQTASLVTNIATGATNNGQFSWHIPATITAGSNYFIRITETNNTSVNDTSDNPFSIAAGTGTYYVNDGTVNPGDVTTAPGNDANDGLTPATPKATIQSVLSTYTFSAGDTIIVDQGVYNISANILLTAAYNGITIRGPGATALNRYASTIEADSPTNYYRLGDSSGTVATDSSGNGNNATYVNGVALGQTGALPGDAGTSAGFNGTNQYVQLPSGFANFGNGFSFEAWVNPTTAAINAPFFDLGNGTSNEIFFSRQSNGNVLQIGGSYGTVTTGSVLQQNIWQFIAVTISNAGAVTIYRNGVSVGTGTITLPQNVSRTTNFLGKSNNGSNALFAGQMQEAAFYGSALSAAQIANHFSANGQAILNRGNTTSGAADFQLDGVSNITLSGLTLTGGFDGVISTSGVPSSHVTVQNSIISNNPNAGIDLSVGNADNFTLSGSTLENCFYGVNGSSVIGLTISGNTFFGNISAVSLSGVAGALVSGNSVFDNGSGSFNALSVSNGNAALPSTISNNVVHDNSGNGIVNIGNVLAVNNTVYNNGGGSGSGIVDNGGEARNNTVYGNSIGITVSGLALVDGNHVYHNVGAGIASTNGQATISGNFIYSNGTWGVTLAGVRGVLTTVANNLIYANTTGGIDVTNDSSINITNNTVYQPTGTVFRTDTTANSPAPTFPIVIQNNIFVAGGGPVYVIDDWGFPGFQADYNDIYITGSATIGTVAGHSFANKTDWIFESGSDLHSIWSDPKFISPAGADGLLGFSGGVDHGGDDNFHVQPSSPTIDTGNPTAEFTREPAPNGGRDNIGSDGDSSSAAASPSATVQVTAPTSLEKLQAGHPYTIQWMSSGLLSTQTLTEVHAGGAAVGEWNAAEYQIGTLSTTTTNSAINTTGVTNPAPQAVYQSAATAASGIGNTLNYSIPVADGTYTIRLDFAEPFETSAGQRKFDVLLQGQTVQSAYDIFAAAGSANHKATSLTFTVTASGGTGISLQLKNDTSDPAILNGFEVMTANAGAPAAQTANIQLSTDNGATWSTIATNEPMDTEGRGSFVWTPSTATNGYTGLIRVVANNPGATTGVTSGNFLIANSGANFYVNGNHNAGGSFTTAGGSNLNDGKSPSTPMSSIQAVLNAYHPGAGQTIFVDAGTYNLFTNLLLPAIDSGLTIQGPSGATAILNRGNTASSDYVFDLQGATNVTLDHLGITGAQIGVNSTFGVNSTGVTVSNSNIFSNTSDGIFASGGDNNWLITGNSIHDAGGGGVGIGISTSTGMTISNNTVFNNPLYGIQVQGASSSPLDIVSGNTVDANGTGIYARIGVTVSGNTAFSNSAVGIEIDAGGLASGNTVFKQTANSAEGILVINGSEARSNTVYGNFFGIVSNNNQLNTVDRNIVYSNNSIGISVTAPTQLAANLVYANGGAGVAFASVSNSSFSSSIVGNTIYQFAADAVKITSSPGITVKNNILWTQAGDDLDLDTASQSGLVSDYNDLYVTASGKVGVWGGTTQSTLTNWQSASSEDAHSLSANPNFVDIDGTDNVLGFNPAGNGGQGYNGGIDDNFSLNSASPAIDSGYSWAGYTTDIQGAGRKDDPGTGNTGSSDYSAAVQGSSSFNAASGTAKGWRLSSPATFSLTLPFTFNFYGTAYTTAWISNTGVIRLGTFQSTDPAASIANSDAALLTAPMIAPLWGNMITNGTVSNDVFVDTSVSNQVTIRWNATNVSNNANLNFAVVLFSNGQIRFDYGAGNSGLTPTVGISMGDGQHAQFASYDGQSTLTNANSVLFTFVPGVTDIGAYEFQGSSSDTSPPTITATSPTTIQIGGSTTPIAQIGLTFSEPINAVDASAATNYQLLGAGADNLFGTSDDVSYSLSPQYTVGGTIVQLNIVGGNLQPGLYRLTVPSSGAGTIHDVSGNALDGDANGTAGGNYVRTFTVGYSTTQPSVIAQSVNLTVAVPSITLQFSTDVSASLCAADLVLQNLTNATTVPGGAIQLNYNAATNTATFTFPGYAGGVLPDGDYQLTLPAASVTDALGTPLTADDVLSFFVLTGDVNHDGRVDVSDLAAVASNWLGTGKTYAQGDLNHDGVVNAADLSIVSANWDRSLTNNTTPIVNAENFVYQSSPNQLVFTVNENVGGSLSASSLNVINTISGTPVAVSGYTYNSTTNTATFSLPVSLANGTYRATFQAIAFTDALGHGLASTYTLNFFILAGDANHDGVVNVSDLLALASNWQGTGKTYAQGDFNHDGVVNIADLQILAANWNKTPSSATAAGPLMSALLAQLALPAPSSPPAVTPVPVAVVSPAPTPPKAPISAVAAPVATVTASPVTATVYVTTTPVPVTPASAQPIQPAAAKTTRLTTAASAAPVIAKTVTFVQSPPPIAPPQAPVMTVATATIKRPPKAKPQAKRTPFASAKQITSAAAIAPTINDDYLDDTSKKNRKRALHHGRKLSE